MATTSFLLPNAEGIAREIFRVGFFSLEMKKGPLLRPFNF
jgi:hypothetical protein